MRPIVFFAISLACLSIAVLAQSPKAPFTDKDVELGRQMQATFDTMEYRIRVVTVADGLLYPYCLTFLPDGNALVTELSGKVRMIRKGELVSTPVATIPGVYYKESLAVGATGLMDIALHPRFAENRMVYLTYNKSGEAGATIVLARGTLNGSELVNVKDLLVTDAWAKNDGNLSSRIAFGPDGFLYMTVSFHNDMNFSQDLTKHGGKVLRLLDDGTPAPGNPFAGKEGDRPEIFTYGHRGIHGIAIHPLTGEAWINEHGDEVNILKSGGNYGWPFFGVMGAGGGIPTPPAPRGLQVIDPYISWNPVLNVSGMMFYTGDKFPKWKGNLFIGGLSTEQIHLVAFRTDRPTLSEPLYTQVREAVLTHIGQRVRDVRQGPDGFIYFITYDDKSGKVMRIEPAN
jgi:glucose/arabinose dehydrogenase